MAWFTKNVTKAAQITNITYSDNNDHKFSCLTSLRLASTYADKVITAQIRLPHAATAHTHTPVRPFVRDYPREPVPERRN